MKKINLKSLKLNKKLISNVTEKKEDVIGGYPASALSRCNDGCISRFYVTICCDV